jgi:hypothetical protein
MSLRLVMLDRRTGPHNDGPLLFSERTVSSTARTGVSVAELSGLLVGGRLEGPGEEGLDGGHGDFFHLVEVDIEAGSVLAPVLADDDFSPAFGEFGDALQIFGRWLA